MSLFLCVKIRFDRKMYVALLRGWPVVVEDFLCIVVGALMKYCKGLDQVRV